MLRHHVRRLHAVVFEIEGTAVVDFGSKDLQRFSVPEGIFREKDFSEIPLADTARKTPVSEALFHDPRRLIRSLRKRGDLTHGMIEEESPEHQSSSSSILRRSVRKRRQRLTA